MLKILTLETKLRNNQTKVLKAPDNTSTSYRLLLLERSKIKDDLLEEYRIYFSRVQGDFK